MADRCGHDQNSRGALAYRSAAESSHRTIDLRGVGFRGGAVMSRRALGKGLGALIPTSADVDLREPAEAGLQEVPGLSLQDIPVEQITANPNQPRQQFDEEALAELVHSAGDRLAAADRRAAHRAGVRSWPGRRWRAAREAGWTTIPAVVRDTADADLLRDALLENLHRATQSPRSGAYQQLLSDFGVTQEELADRLGRSRPHLSNTLRLLKLPPAVQRQVAAGVRSAGHARALLSLQNRGADGVVGQPDRR